MIGHGLAAVRFDVHCACYWVLQIGGDVLFGTNEANRTDRIPATLAPFARDGLLGSRNTRPHAKQADDTSSLVRTGADGHTHRKWRQLLPILRWNGDHSGCRRTIKRVVDGNVEVRGCAVGSSGRFLLTCKQEWQSDLKRLHLGGSRGSGPKGHHGLAMHKA